MRTPYTERADSLGAICLWIAVMVLVGIAFACSGCAIAPEKKVVTSVQTIPPTQVPLPVSCIKKIPDPVTVTICVPVALDDPNCSTLRRYYLMEALIDDYERYRIQADVEIKRCADAAVEVK